MSSQVALCEHHARDCLQAAEKTEDPWRARCFSGMRWSGCGTGLQHPSNRSCVLFVDARQHRDRASYIEAIYDPFAATDRAFTSGRLVRLQCAIGLAAWQRRLPDAENFGGEVS